MPENCKTRDRGWYRPDGGKWAGFQESISHPGTRARLATFGAKLSVSLVNGYSFVNRISWDNFNEGPDLINQIEKYKQRYGFYPESVHADKIYRNRDNLRFCKENGIRLSRSRLGRPPKITDKANAAMVLTVF